MLSRILFLLIMPWLSPICYGQNFPDEIKKAERAYGAGKMDSCAYYFNSAFLMGEASGVDFYNAAVCNALAGDKTAAFKLLGQALHKGINISKLKIDPDLETLHTEVEWKKILLKADEIQKKEAALFPYPSEAMQLAELWERDQYWRFRLGKAYKKNDTTTANMLWGKIKPTDSVNLAHFVKIIERIGWPTKSMVGTLGANTAFLIIDHADRETMEKYFPFIEEAAKSGEASLKNYATLKDRILVNRGKKQLYGTQRYWDGTLGKFVYFPIEDENNLNKRRMAVGLDPLPDF